MDLISLLFLIGLLVITSKTNTFSEHRRLLNHHEPNLDNTIRPVINQSKFVNVSIEVHLQAILGLDEKQQLLHSTISLVCHWKYETLAWNESEFSRIESIYVSPAEAWIPDLIASNTIDSSYVLTENRADMLHIRIKSNGDATWITGGNIRTSCSIDISKYPFDVQKCNITITKSTPDSEVLIVALKDQVDRELYRENGEWGLESSVIMTRTLYSYITFIDINLTLKRHSLFYVLNIIIPVILLSFMIVLSFKIPAASGERIGYCIALLLTFVVLLNLVSDSMPRVPKHVSYLQLYIIYQLTVAIVITALSILLVRTIHVQNDVKMSSVIKLYNRWYSFKKRSKTSPSNSKKIKELNEKEDTSEDSRIDTSDIQQPSEIEGDSSKWTQFVVQHADKSLFAMFMMMCFISTVLVLCLVTI